MEHGSISTDPPRQGSHDLVPRKRLIKIAIQFSSRPLFVNLLCSAGAPVCWKITSRIVLFKNPSTLSYGYNIVHTHTYKNDPFSSYTKKQTTHLLAISKEYRIKDRDKQTKIDLFEFLDVSRRKMLIFDNRIPNNRNKKKKLILT